MTNGISNFFESTLMPESNTAPMDAPNPYWQGHRVVDRDDLFPKGFSSVELDATYANLANDAHDLGLLLESPSLDELDYYNPGRDEVEEAYVLEAITVEHFSRTERRMAAVVRVLNRHLSDSEIMALAPVVGKPKKSGSFAYVIVQLPFSDGQTVNVVFHSPEGDKKRIGPSDAIIAFRWLLNKRDITHVVAPEDGEEVSLETIAKRITQLVVKNSARFERQQKAAQAERKELDEAREAVKNAEEQQSDLIDQITAKAKEAESIEARLSNTLSLLEKQKTINAELQAKIDALRAQKSQDNAGKANDEEKISKEIEHIMEVQNKVKSLSEEELKGLRQYTQGTDAGYKDRLEVSYIIKDKSNTWLYELKECQTPHDKYKFIKGNVDNHSLHQAKIGQSGRFSDQIDLNSALRKGIKFSYFELSPRHGYLVAKFVIDLSGQKSWEDNNTAPHDEKVTSTATSDTNAAPHYAPDGTVDKDGVYIKHNGWWYTKGQDGQPKDRLGVSYQDRLEKEWRDSQEKATEGGSQAEPSFVSDLQDIIAGKYDADTEKVLALLESAIATAEKDGSLEKYEAMLEEASDHLTDLLAKEAA